MTKQELTELFNEIVAKYGDVEEPKEEVTEEVEETVEEEVEEEPQEEPKEEVAEETTEEKVADDVIKDLAERLAKMEERVTALEKTTPAYGIHSGESNGDVSGRDIYQETMNKYFN